MNKNSTRYKTWLVENRARRQQVAKLEIQALEQFHRIFGIRGRRYKKQAFRASDAYPVRLGPLGTTKNIKQGVAGWRSNYYRLSEINKPTDASWMEKYIKLLNHEFTTLKL